MITLQGCRKVELKMYIVEIKDAPQHCVVVDWSASSEGELLESGRKTLVANDCLVSYYQLEVTGVPATPLDALLAGRTAKT